ncbi:MAG: metallophosphoesterase, partial [Phycisphaerales bacterium]
QPDAPPPFTPGAWTLAILPDTQVYALRFPGLFTAQTGWIALNRERLNIRLAIHLGDIVDKNTPREWQNARDSMRLLDGAVPYCLVPGNHDYGPGGSASTRDTLLNDYFHFKPHAAQPTFGGAMEEGKLDNTFHLFEAGGREWIVVCLEWAPRDEAIAWANQLMEQHPARAGILVTHAYLNNNDLRYDHTDTVNPQQYNPHHYKTPGPVNDGEQLWQKLVRRHNFAFTLNGHVLGDGTGYLASKNDAGRTVHQLLSNYQLRPAGGEGFLRLMEFQPDGKTVRIKSYSPVFDTYLTAPDQQFEVTLDPAPTPPPAP